MIAVNLAGQKGFKYDPRVCSVDEKRRTAMLKRLLAMMVLLTCGMAQSVVVSESGKNLFDPFGPGMPGPVVVKSQSDPSTSASITGPTPATMGADLVAMAVNGALAQQVPLTGDLPSFDTGTYGGTITLLNDYASYLDTQVNQYLDKNAPSKWDSYNESVTWNSGRETVTFTVTYASDLTRAEDIMKQIVNVRAAQKLCVALQNGSITPGEVSDATISGQNMARALNGVLHYYKTQLIGVSGLSWPSSSPYKGLKTMVTTYVDWLFGNKGQYSDETENTQSALNVIADLAKGSYQPPTPAPAKPSSSSETEVINVMNAALRYYAQNVHEQIPTQTSNAPTTIVSAYEQSLSAPYKTGMDPTSINAILGAFSDGTTTAAPIPTFKKIIDWYKVNESFPQFAWTTTDPYGGLIVMIKNIQVQTGSDNALVDLLAKVIALQGHDNAATPTPAPPTPQPQNNPFPADPGPVFF